jgi:hypothetical protein
MLKQRQTRENASNKTHIPPCLSQTLLYLQAEQAEQAVQAQQASRSLSSNTSSVFPEKGTLKGSNTSIQGLNSFFIIFSSCHREAITSPDLLLKKCCNSLPGKHLQGYAGSKFAPVINGTKN